MIILAGMYAAHSEWIDYEISEAVRMGKFIIGVRPWGQKEFLLMYKMQQMLWLAGIVQVLFKLFGIMYE